MDHYLGAVLSGKAGMRGNASRGAMRMLLDDELVAHDTREAKRSLTRTYVREFVAAYAATALHPTQSGAVNAWKATGHGSQRRNWVCSYFAKLPGQAKRKPGRPPGKSQRK